MTFNQNSNQQPTSQSTAKMGKLVLLPIDAITSQEQVRKTFLNIDELAASILKEGLQMPITVTAPNANGQHTIIQGERRWRACKHAGLTHIQAIIKEEPQSEIQRIIAQLTENIWIFAVIGLRVLTDWDGAILAGWDRAFRCAS